MTQVATERGQALHVAVADGTPAALFADPGRLRQVLLNLLSNAVTFARPGEVWLIAEPGRDTSQAIRLMVTDDGPAIAAEKRKQLFLPLAPLDRRGAGVPDEPALGAVDLPSSDHPDGRADRLRGLAARQRARRQCVLADIAGGRAARQRRAADT